MISGNTAGLGVQLLISLAMSSSSSSVSENKVNSNSDDDDDAFEKQIKKVEDAEVLEWTLYTIYRLCLHNACPIPMLQVSNQSIVYNYTSPLS